MKLVTGYANYSVDITCPDCGCTFDVIWTENDDDNAVTNPMFENTTESCTNMNVEIACPSCDAELILDNLEY